MKVNCAYSLHFLEPGCKIIPRQTKHRMGFELNLHRLFNLMKSWRQIYQKQTKNNLGPIEHDITEKDVGR